MFWFLPIGLWATALANASKAKHLGGAYLIDLDAKPETRWAKVVEDHRPGLMSIFEYYQQKLPWVITKAVSLLNLVAPDGLLPIFPEETQAEIRGMCATLFNGDHGTNQCVILQLIYEMSCYCSSIVQRDDAGNVMHGRNLDWERDMQDKLANITINIDLQRGGKVIASATTFAGYLGIVSGVAHGKFTLSFDERDSAKQAGTHSYSSILTNILFWAVHQDAQVFTFWLRGVLENAESYEDVYQKATTTKFISPAYIVLGGIKPNEGAVIVRARNRVEDVWKLSDSQPFVLVTNYDPSMKQPADDDRFDVELKMLKEDVPRTPDRLFEILSTEEPCGEANCPLNRGTVFTTIMSAVPGYYPYNTTLWSFAPEPEAPEITVNHEDRIIM